MKRVITLFLVASSLVGSAQTIDMGNGITIIGEVVAFDSTHHRIDRCPVLDWNFQPVCLIDGKPFFGQDMDMALPRMELVALRIAIGDVAVALDVSGMFNPNSYAKLRTDQFKVREAEGGHEVLGLFSDGAGTYVAVWKVIAGGSIRTVISRSENEVVHWWHEVPYPEPSKR